MKQLKNFFLKKREDKGNALHQRNDVREKYIKVEYEQKNLLGRCVRTIVGDESRTHQPKRV
jgi:hypothetical protein